jgi:hypothetical protein
MQTPVLGLNEGRKLIQSYLQQVLLITQSCIIFLLISIHRESSAVAKRVKNAYEKVHCDGNPCFGVPGTSVYCNLRLYVK